MTPDVEVAIREIEQAFPEHHVEVEPEPQGGAYVIVENLSLGTQYASRATWCGFLIPFQYPYADVYPHYIDGQTRRVDSQTLGSAFQGPLVWRNRSALQVSRRSNRWDAMSDTAVMKLSKVMEWINSQ